MVHAHYVHIHVPCTTSGACITCQAPFSINPAANGTCYTCNTPNCANCLVSNTFNCQQCNNNYGVTGSNTCAYNGSCSINCAVCVLGQYCQVCNPGYTVSPTS